MRVKQAQFYRMAGIREKAQFTRPRLIPQRKLELPLESIVHYFPSDTSVMGPTLQEPLFLNIPDRKFIEHVVVLEGTEGNPRRTVLNPTILQNEYRRKTRGVHPLRKDAALSINPRNVLVVNYGMLNPLYRYIQSYKANYFRWYNNNQTFWSKVADINTRFHWNQYIEFQLPEVIPTLEQFKRFEAGITQAVLDVFNTPQALNLTDFWYWLGDKRELSAISKVNMDNYDKINFIFRIQGYFFILNLGVVNDWRLDKEEEGDTGIEGSALQRRFIKLLNSVADVMAGVSQVEEEEEVTEETPLLTEKKETVLPESDITPTGDYALPSIDLDKLESQPTKAEKPVVIKPVEVPKVRLPEAGDIQAKPTVINTPESPTLVNAITDKAMELQENQLITVKAFNKIVEDAQRFKIIKDPYGSDKTIEEMLTISSEELVIPETPQFTDRSTVIDKSMLNSKLKVMTKTYVKDIMKRDVLNAVMSVQRQGVSVIDYKIEVQHDAMNQFEVHRVTLKPVRGRQSTVVFRLPVVDEDGRFISNGNKVRARLQRVD